jgi:ribonuclease HII
MKIIGIDEAGRGPLAGPVTVGVFCGESKIKNNLIKILGGRVMDSKQLSPDKRESIFQILNELKMKGDVDFTVAHSTPAVIDKIGISKAIKLAMGKCLKGFDSGSEVRLDGSLKAPVEFQKQKTIINGDATDPFIACASIVAKVTRDREMCRLAKKFPLYKLEVHKGYGTVAHRALIRRHGLSGLHRVSFCGNI